MQSPCSFILSPCLPFHDFFLQRFLLFRDIFGKLPNAPPPPPPSFKNLWFVPYTPSGWSLLSITITSFMRGGAGPCVVFLGKTLYSYSASLHQEYKWVPVNCWGNLTNCGGVTCDGLASRPGGSKNILIVLRFILQKLEKAPAALSQSAPRLHTHTRFHAVLFICCRKEVSALLSVFAIITVKLDILRFVVTGYSELGISAQFV